MGLGDKLTRKQVKTKEAATQRETNDRSLWARLLQTGGVIAIFLGVGIFIGMGYFSKPVLPPPPSAEVGAMDPGAPGFAPAILGAMATERRPDGQEWQSIVLTGRYNSDLDGVVHMSIYQEPANILRARLEAEARRDGWTDLNDAPLPEGRLELSHADGRIQIISIDEYPDDLRSVTVFTGKLARR